MLLLVGLFSIFRQFRYVSYRKLYFFVDEKYLKSFIAHGGVEFRQPAMLLEFGRKWGTVFFNGNRVLFRTLTLGSQVPFAYPAMCGIQRETEK